MSIRAFLSIATERDGLNAPLEQQFRKTIADALMHPLVHCIVQEWLEADGNNPLVMLAETICHHCDILLQVISDQPGQIPPRDHTLELIRHLDRTGLSLKYRFPCLFETWPTCTSEVWQHLTYTQWEAWMAKYYEKQVIVFRFEGAEQTPKADDTINSWSEYLRIASPFFQLHSTHSSLDKLSIAIYRVLLLLLNRQQNEAPKVTWTYPPNFPLNSLANRVMELNLFDRITSPKSDQRILFLSGKSNLGKTTLLNAFQFKCRTLQHVRPIAADCKGGVAFDEILQKLSIDLTVAKGIQRKKDPQAELFNLGDASFFARLRTYSLHELPVVVFLDTYEDASRQCIQWVEESLLPFIATNDNVAAVIAGQITPTHDKIWLDSMFCHEVEPIRLPAEWCRFRDCNQVIGISDDMIRKLVAWADGDPGFLGPVILQNNQGRV